MSAIIEYVREAWPKASEVLEDVLDKTYDATVNGMIFGAPTWLSRQIDDWSQRTLPPATAKVVATAVVALPLVVLDLVTPFAITVSIQLILCVGRFCHSSSGENIPQTADEPGYLNCRAFPNSAGLAAILYGIARVANGIFRRDVSTGCFGATLVVLGLPLLLSSDFLIDTLEAVQELYERL